MIDKLRGKSFSDIIAAILKRAGLYLNKFFYLLCLIVTIDENQILLESEGDFCDNAFALYETMLKNNVDKSHKIIWVAKDLKSKPDKVKNVISKNNFVPNIKRMYCLARTKYYIYDHQNIMEPFLKRKGQCIIFLSHGCGFKAAKGGNDKKSKIDVMYATSPFFFKSAANFAGCDVSKLRDLGLPRNDYLLSPSSDKEKRAIGELGLIGFKNIIFWMPTFRSSVVKSISEDYILGDTGLPVLYDHNDLVSFNRMLAKNNTLCVIKVHHLQAELPVFREQMSNILILLDDDIKTVNLQLYQILKYSDILITDYSSIATDYYLLDKPIIYTLDDFDKYMKSRGFYPENPLKYFVGYHVYNKEGLISSINEIIYGTDKYTDSRSDVMKMMHTFIDDNSGIRILKDLDLI